MTEQFNRINQAIGANRMRVCSVDETYIEFEIIGWAAFNLQDSGEVTEWIRGFGYSETVRSRWLHGISLGKKRDDAGVLS